MSEQIPNPNNFTAANRQIYSPVNNVNNAIFTAPQKQPFAASKKELFTAALILIPALCYANYPVNYNSRWLWLITALSLIEIAEYTFYSQKRKPEQFVWLICFMAVTASFVFEIGTVWDDGQKALFIHLFAVWYILARSGKLIAGEFDSGLDHGVYPELGDDKITKIVRFMWFPYSLPNLVGLSRVAVSNLSANVTSSGI